MPNEFVISRKGLLETYYNFEDIPLDLDHVIKFLPEIPPPPHTSEQHMEIKQWEGKLKMLMLIEKENKKCP